MSATVEKLPTRAALDGYVDVVADGCVYGWAWDRQRPADRLEITVRIGDRTVAEGLADRARDDLAGSGIGDGIHAFAIALPEGTPDEALAVTARSPSSGETLDLPLRQAPQLDDVPQELQRVTATVHSLQAVQRQTASAVLGVLKEIRQTRTGSVEERLAEVMAGQQALQKRFETVEVFLLRFDTLLRQFDEKLNAAPDTRPTAEARLRRIVAGLSVATVAALVAAFLF